MTLTFDYYQIILMIFNHKYLIFFFFIVDFHVRMLFRLDVFLCILDAFWHWNLCEGFNLVLYNGWRGLFSAPLSFDFSLNKIIFNIISSFDVSRELKYLALNCYQKTALGLYFKFLYFRYIRSMVCWWNS